MQDSRLKITTKMDRKSPPSSKISKPLKPPKSLPSQTDPSFNSDRIRLEYFKNEGEKIKTPEKEIKNIKKELIKSEEIISNLVKEISNKIKNLNPPETNVLSAQSRNNLRSFYHEFKITSYECINIKLLNSPNNVKMLKSKIQKLIRLDQLELSKIETHEVNKQDLIKTILNAIRPIIENIFNLSTQLNIYINTKNLLNEVEWIYSANPEEIESEIIKLNPSNIFDEIKS